MCLAGGTLAQNTCRERHTTLQDEPVRWMSWRSLPPRTSRDEAKGEGKEEKNAKNVTWSFWSLVDIILTAMVHLSITTMLKMSLKTTATARIILDGTERTGIS